MHAILRGAVHWRGALRDLVSGSPQQFCNTFPAAASLGCLSQKATKQAESQRHLAIERGLLLYLLMCVLGGHKCGQSFRPLSFSPFYEQCSCSQRDVHCMFPQTTKHPLPLARTTLKNTKMTETAPPVVLTRALFAPTLRKHKQPRYLSAWPTYDGLHARTKRHVATSGSTVIVLPKIPSPAPNHRTHLIFTDNQKIGVSSVQT